MRIDDGTADGGRRPDNRGDPTRIRKHTHISMIRSFLRAVEDPWPLIFCMFVESHAFLGRFWTGVSGVSGSSTAFAKDSVLAYRLPVTGLLLRGDGKHYFVRIGNRESSSRNSRIMSSNGSSPSH